MAITKSAKKALRQAKRREAQNSIYRNKIKKLLKEARGFILAKKPEEAKKILPQVFKILDKGVKIGIIKKNNAARKKSRLSKALAKSL